MNGTVLQALLTGLLLASPIAAFGFIPTSALAATDRPRQTWPYAVYGSFAILLFSFCGWLLHLALLLSGAPGLELPLDILALWGVNRLLRAAVHRTGELAAQAQFVPLNCAVLGAGLVVIDRYPHDYSRALLFAAGLAAGFLISLLVIAYFRERIETGRFSPQLAGWPSFLLLCSFYWVACQGLALLIR